MATQFFRTFEAPVNFTQTLTDGFFLSNIINGAPILSTDHVTFTRSRQNDDTVFINVGIQTSVRSGASGYLFKFALFDVTDGESFPDLTAFTGTLITASLSNSVMAVSRFPNVTRYLVMNLIAP